MNKVVRKELRARGLDVSNHCHNPNKSVRRLVFVDGGYMEQRLV